MPSHQVNIEVCIIMCIDMCIDVCRLVGPRHMWIGMCAGMGIDMCGGMCLGTHMGRLSQGMPVDMCGGMCVDMCVGTHMDMCIGVCVGIRACSRHTFFRIYHIRVPMAGCIECSPSCEIPRSYEINRSLGFTSLLSRGICMFKCLKTL